MNEQEKTYTKSEIITLIKKVIADQKKEYGAKIKTLIEENQKLEQNFNSEDFLNYDDVIETVTKNNEMIENHRTRIFETYITLMSLNRIIESDQVEEVLNK